MEYKLGTRWDGPNAVSRQRAVEEQKMKDAVWLEKSDSDEVDLLGTVEDSRFDISILQKRSTTTRTASLAFALSRCTLLETVTLVDSPDVPESSFDLNLIDALLYARPSLTGLKWCVKMEHRTQDEWRKWEGKVRKVTGWESFWVRDAEV
jgi:hypothetical protein